MKAEAQRIAIAKACGWKVHPKHKGLDLSEELECWTDDPPRGFASELRLKRDLPDYLNDLNAMHEAEKTLGGAQMIDYGNLLPQIVADHWPNVCMATAAQRAEAFLRTLGLWKESEK